MPGPDNDAGVKEEIALDPDFLRSRREAWWILAAWAACCAWTIAAGAIFGYDLEAEEVATTLGMPTWIFWSVAFPWFLAVLFSIVFAVFVIRDHALDEVADEGAEGKGDGDG